MGVNLKTRWEKNNRSNPSTSCFSSCRPPSCRCRRSRLTWRTRPSTTSSARSSSRSSATWGSLARRCWACPAPTRPLTTGACRQGRATAPPTALWPYWPWMPTARKRWERWGGFEGRGKTEELHGSRTFFSPSWRTLLASHFFFPVLFLLRWTMSSMTLSVWSPVTAMKSSGWWTRDCRWPTRYGFTL